MNSTFPFIEEQNGRSDPGIELSQSFNTSCQAKVTIHCQHCLPMGTETLVTIKKWFNFVHREVKSLEVR